MNYTEYKVKKFSGVVTDSEDDLDAIEQELAAKLDSKSAKIL